MDREHCVQEGETPDEEARVMQDDRRPQRDREDIEDQVEQRRDRLAREEQGERRAEDGEKVEHGPDMGTATAKGRPHVGKIIFPANLLWTIWRLRAELFRKFSGLACG